MIKPDDLVKFTAQLDSLRFVVAESNTRATSEPPDALFSDNQNVFVKAYLVSACSILEAFVQELAFTCLTIFKERATTANLPHNAVMWHDKNSADPKTLKYEAFAIIKTKKDVCDLVSANYYKTMKAFQRIGIDISCDAVTSHKDFISSRATKRNEIVHHNDQALDLSLTDVLDTIDIFKDYTRCIFETVSANPHLQA